MEAFKSHHTGIEITTIAVPNLNHETFNRTTLELKLGRRFIKFQRWIAVNRTTLELKSS